MRTLTVAAGSCRYEVHTGSGVLSRAADCLTAKGYDGRLVIITDTTVNRLYGAALRGRLQAGGYIITLLDVPEGEASKSLKIAGRLYEQLTTACAERSTPILALGGGVIGDLAGFVAATYLRGVPLVQVPTTLLAQVDSSIGGKVAIDHGKLKNIVGAFYQPQMVIADTDTLKTLSPDDFASGLAEVIKHAAVWDSSFFDYLEAHMERILARETASLEETVWRAEQIKVDVVARDERDTGLRNILNYGHTIGHALEAVSNFSLKHGQAVGVGMVAAARISRHMNLLSEAEVNRLTALIAKAGLPVKIPAVDTAAILSAMSHDKKVCGGVIRFILLKFIGEAVVSSEVPMPLVEQMLGAL